MKTLGRRNRSPANGGRMNRLIIAMLVLALGYFGFDKFMLGPRERRRWWRRRKIGRRAAFAESHARGQRQLDRRPSFREHECRRREPVFFRRHFRRLPNALVHVDGIAVASRTSSFAYPLAARSARPRSQTRSRSPTSWKAACASRRHKVRITAQFIHALHDRHLFSQTYDRDLTDIFAIQDEIAMLLLPALAERSSTHRRSAS